MIHNATVNDYGKVSKSCKMYIVLLPIMLITTGIGSIFLSA